MRNARDTELVSITDAKVEVRASSSQDDAALQGLIAAASGWVSEYCQRRFLQAGYAEEHDGTGGPDLYLDHWPVAGLSLWQNSSGVFDSSSLLAARSSGTGDYVVYSEESGLGRVRRINGIWPVGIRSIRATYTGGYTADQIPEPIRRACLLIIGHEFGKVRHGLHLMGNAPMPAAGGNLSVDNDIAEKVLPWLAPFRRPSLVA